MDAIAQSNSEEKTWESCGPLSQPLGNHNNQGVNRRVVIMANKRDGCARRKDYKVQRAVDGEKAMIKIEWLLANSHL